MFTAPPTTPRIWYHATTHACIRLGGRVPALATCDMDRRRRILVGMCHHGHVLPFEAWVIGQYFIEAFEWRTRQRLFLAMQWDTERPNTSIVRTILRPEEFALKHRVA